jgi:hypothetical protein
VIKIPQHISSLPKKKTRATGKAASRGRLDHGTGSKKMGEAKDGT